MKQTAVEWLVETMIKQGYFVGNEPLSYTNLDHLQEQAKEMEKEQIMLASGTGYRDGILYANGKQCLYETVEQYYNKTYKQD